MSIAQRLRPLLVDRQLEQIDTPQRRHALDRWPEKLAGTRVGRVDTHGKNLFLRFDNGITIHSHLRMSGRWRILEQGFDQGKRARSAWLVLETSAHSMVQFNGPILELIRDTRLRYDPYLRRLGPDILADELDWPASSAPARRRPDAAGRRRDPGPAHARGHREPVEERDPLRVQDRPVAADVGHQRRRPRADGRCARRLMIREVRRGGRLAGGEVFEHGGHGCRRCGTTIRVRGQWDENRMTYWCPKCQT